MPVYGYYADPGPRATEREKLMERFRATVEAKARESKRRRR